MVVNKEYRTIGIRTDLRERLVLLRDKTNLTYSEIIEKLFQQSGGIVVDDVIRLHREPVAFSLKYEDSTGVCEIKDVHYAELAKAKVGTAYGIITLADKGGVDFVNTSARVIWRDGDDVVVLLTESSCKGGEFSSVDTLVHIKLF